MKNEKLHRVASWCLIGLVGGVLAYLFLTKLATVLLPFLLAFFVALLLRPIVLYLCKKSRLSQPSMGILLFFLLVLALTYLIVTLTVYLGGELRSAVSSLMEELNAEENFLSRFFDSAESLKERFPFLEGNVWNGSDTLYDGIIKMVKGMLSDLSGRLTQGVTRKISALPDTVFAISVSLIAMFYFFKDYTKILSAISARIPAAWCERLHLAKARLTDGMSLYLRAYLLLMLLTFAELLAGFLVLGVDYAVLLALITAILDLLPVIGVGLVLIPWAIFSFVLGDTSLGIGLLILYLVLYLVRQILEPKLVSGAIGVHPLLTLLAVYGGYRLFGVAGLIFGPLVAFLIKALFEKEEESTGSPPQK